MTGPPECALVLTAGIGQRLRPLSHVRAKPAVPIAGEPLVRRIIAWLGASRVSKLVLNLHHRPETITRVVGDGSDLGVVVRYSWEQPLLGSAGGPRRAMPLLDASPFLLVNGDTLTDVNLADLATAHTRAGALVTMALVPNPAPERYGGVQLDADGRVSGFTRPADPTPAYHFIGVQVAEAAAFQSVPEGEPAESVNGIYRALIDRRAIHGHVCAASFRDVGTPADYLDTCLALAREAGPRTSLAGVRCRVHPSAQLVRTVLWDDVEVGEDVRLEECVVADGVRVSPRTHLARRVLVPRNGTSGPGSGDPVVAPLDPS